MPCTATRLTASGPDTDVPASGTGSDNPFGQPASLTRPGAGRRAAHRLLANHRLGRPTPGVPHASPTPVRSAGQRPQSPPGSDGRAPDQPTVLGAGHAGRGVGSARCRGARFQLFSGTMWHGTASDLRLHARVVYVLGTLAFLHAFALRPALDPECLAVGIGGGPMAHAMPGGNHGGDAPASQHSHHHATSTECAVGCVYIDASVAALADAIEEPPLVAAEIAVGSADVAPPLPLRLPLARGPPHAG